MKSSAVLVLACLAFTVFGAPVHGPKSLDKPSAPAKQVNALEAELEEAENHASDEVQSNQERSQDGEPEVKRSERVSTDEVDEVAEEEDDFTGLSGNMKAADQDVKDVLKTFFESLKDHPEIVEEILGREGDKILQQSAEEQLLTADDNDVMDMSAFQKPSPQLIKSPKQVEKKTGEFPAYPRFIYKSPMRNSAERDEMTSSAGQSKPQQRSGPSDITVDNNGKFKVDISNAIPVIQQPSTMHKTDDSVSIVPDQLEEGGVEDLDTLREEQDEYSQQHPFINPLPIFPQPADHAPDLDSNSGPEDAHQIAAEAHPHSEESPPEKKSNQNEAEVSHAEEDQEAGAAIADATDPAPGSPQTKPHYLTGQEIAAETLAHPVAQESSVPFYYYYYDGDGQGAGEVDEDDEDNDAQEDESQLHQINSNSEEEKDDVDEDEDEDGEEEADENTEEVDNEDDEEEDMSEEPETEVSEENGDETDDTEDSEEITDETEENTEEIDEVQENNKDDQQAKIDLSKISRFLGTRPQHTNMNHLDPDEAALMSLAGSAQRQQGKVVGPAM